ncbi:MAG: prolipoprotein diacylglyceryl transferase [Firmicutes bacterium HGW-Firmicutes-16]|nr:MAG: prolipoprotein diacylglyceryl transferase [Firmicutes bacterium HGW-Firmicutes-16]
MYNDIFTIGSITIHGYGLMIGIGFVCAILVGAYRGKRRDLDINVIIDIALISIAFGFLGAKLLYVLTDIRHFFEAPLVVLGSEGFVVYGGVLSGALSAVIYCHRKKLSFISYFDLLIPSVAIAQGFGRIGCFLAGCCYGRETDSILGVVFPSGSIAPAGVKLFPTQLFSSGGDFMIAGILLLFSNKLKYKGDSGALYLLLYGIGRFVIEFFRNDYRGSVGMLSTSQFISIFTILIAITLFAVNKKRNILADKVVV